MHYQKWQFDEVVLVQEAQVSFLKVALIAEAALLGFYPRLI